MRVSLIAAVAANGVIGAGGALPWHLPDDFRWFKANTVGKPIVMGRKTWDSLAGALPGRQNIVLTRQSGYVAPGATVVGSRTAAEAAAGDAAELMVIGGGEIFQLFLPRTSHIYLTRVAAEIDGDARFPVIDAADWRLVSSEFHPADARHAHAFQIEVYERAEAIGRQHEPR